MEKSEFLSKVENYGLIIISACVALIYLRIDSLQLGTTPTQWLTFSLFIGYGFFTQYFINTNKRMAAQILSLSITDHLTGLYNRRGFMVLAEQQMRMEERNNKGSLLMLLFADLDKMKAINDNLGHKKGDDALIEVASILKKVFRESDIIARIGGDEFAVLGIAARKSDIGAFESRLHEEVSIHNAYEKREYKISLSIGIASSDPEKHYSIDDLMSMADMLMYEQKRRKQP